ncbi:hypothetical protein HGM15179_021007, partial [Zosterops borbonicus]
EDELEPGNSGPSQIPSLAPVTYLRSKGGNVISTSWKPIPQHAVKDLCKALKQYGRYSPYSRGLLNVLLTGMTAVPADLKHLFRCLTNSTEYKLWEALWKDLLKRALQSLLADPTTAVDEKGVKLTLDHLSGDGQWALAPTQASDIPNPVLDKVKYAAEKAFLGMQPPDPPPTYSTIFQGPAEPYTQFVERLSQVIELQVRKEHAKEETLEEMVFSHANEKCHTAILSLPWEPPPTLQDMLRVCERKVPWLGQPVSHARGKAAIQTAAAMKADSSSASSAPHALAQSKRSFKKNASRPCALCGEMGHWCQQCPIKRDFDKFRNRGGNEEVNSREPGTWSQIEGKFVVIGDCKFTLCELEIVPGLITSNPERFVLWLHCVNPPVFLPKGQIIAQVNPVPSIPVQDGVPEVNAVRAIGEDKPKETCRLVIEEDELEPGNSGPSQIPSLAPVTYLRSKGGNVISTSWKPIPQHAVKDLCKALKQYGRYSPYSRGLLNVLLTGMTAVPADLKHLFRCLTNSTEYKLWEALWKDLLKRALQSLLADPTTAVDEKGVKLTLDHLSGDGQWALAPTQASDIPNPVLDKVKYAAEKAFLGMQPPDPPPTYSTIFQGPAEPYTQFVERLSQVIELQVRKEHAKEETLEEMVFSHANEKCHTAILSLPWEPPPTLQDMLRVCERKVPWLGQPVSHARGKAAIQTAAAMKADSSSASSAPHALAQSKRSFKKNASRPCALCGEMGHWCQQCPIKRDFDKFRNRGGNEEVNSREPGTWSQIEGKFVVIGDCKFTLCELEIVPGLITSNPERFVLWLHCVNPPVFLPKGQIIAQVNPVPSIPVQDGVPEVNAVRAIGEDKPKETCRLVIVAVTAQHPTQKQNWKTDELVWVEQWPLSKQKLKELNEPVEEQLKKGNIEETTSPWNSPVFVIQKSDKTRWRLLHNLRQINNAIEDMGSLQPGMPSPTMPPKNWNLAIIDIKDCFFHIPLHPDNNPCFAFSVPTINQEAPRKRYHWKVLPQGMKSSPVICQWYVSSLLSEVCAAADKSIIHHYMDDVFVCAPNDDLLTHALDLTVTALVAAGFELQESKIQRMPPWKYLGLEIAGVVSRAEQSILQEVSNTALFELLSKLVKLISYLEQPFYVMHTRSHTDLPGFIAEGNRRADALAAPAEMAPLPNIFEQAKIRHQLFHQNAPGLVRRFNLTRDRAKVILATCPHCQQHALPTLSAGVNPRGLNSCEVWQTDVTHFAQFGRQSTEPANRAPFFRKSTTGSKGKAKGPCQRPGNFENGRSSQFSDVGEQLYLVVPDLALSQMEVPLAVNLLQLFLLASLKIPTSGGFVPQSTTDAWVNQSSPSTAPSNTVGGRNEKIEDWLDKLFESWGLSKWAGSRIKAGLLIWMVLVSISFTFILIRRAIVRLISNSTIPSQVSQVFVVTAPTNRENPEGVIPSEDGGNIEEWSIPSEEWHSDQQWDEDLSFESEYPSSRMQSTSF